MDKKETEKQVEESEEQTDALVCKKCCTKMVQYSNGWICPKCIW